MSRQMEEKLQSLKEELKEAQPINLSECSEVVARWKYTGHGTLYLAWDKILEEFGEELAINWWKKTLVELGLFTLAKDGYLDPVEKPMEE